MLSEMQVYKCEVCGNMVEVLYVGGGTLSCCGQPMTHLQGNTTDAATEKHVPVIKKEDGHVRVQVGDVLHPMEEKHFIQWIEVITPSKILRKMLKPGQEPVAEFDVDEEIVKAREYCNLHGVWVAKV